ncbi:type 4a pilus biogenesis protein PilO [bacterium]|nr:type 4a pilus biogenesis protein PilO [bacterium]MBU1753571.1 type 4a pilus biogenesis protein PilO [bacterium]
MKFSQEELKAIGLIVVFIGLTIFSFITYGYKPLKIKSAELDNEIIAKTTELKQIQDIVSNLEMRKAEVRKLREELSYVETRLPKEVNMPELIKTITTLAQENHVVFSTFVPSNPISKDVYKEIPISLATRATYHNFGKFLAAIGNLERILTPTNVQISQLTPTKEDVSTISGNMVITAFVYKP